MRGSRKNVSTVGAALVLAAVAALGACSGSGSASLAAHVGTGPRSGGLPSTPLTGTALAGAALPSIDAPSLTVPSGNPSSEAGPARPVDPATVTATQTKTRSETATPTATPTATVTNTSTPTQTAARAWWPWLLLGLALAALVWLLERRRQADAAVRAWDERLAAADGEASWVEDSLTTRVLSRASTAEAQTIWLAAQPRLLQADNDFHDLAADAPDGHRASRAMSMQGLLRGLVEAVDADLAAPPSAGPDDFRPRRALVDSARGGLRHALDQVIASVERGSSGPAPSSTVGRPPDVDRMWRRKSSNSAPTAKPDAN